MPLNEGVCAGRRSAEVLQWDPDLWLSSLPLCGCEVPERHLSDLNWKDGEMHSERNLDRGEIEEARQEGGGREGEGGGLMIPCFCSDCAEVT